MMINLSQLLSLKNITCFFTYLYHFKVPVAGQTSDEELKASIMKEFFPEEMKREEFENNNVLIAEVWLSPYVYCDYTFFQ